MVDQITSLLRSRKWVSLKLALPAAAILAVVMLQPAAAVSPTVTGVTPGGGPSSGGTLVSITGSGFTGAMSVSFGGTIALPVFVSDVTVTVFSPPHVPGAVAVQVTTPSGTSPVTAFGTFVYGSGAFISAISPTSGTVAGNTLVSIIGGGFTGASGVTFGGSPAAFVVNSDVSISALSPAHTPGTFDVVVVTPLGLTANTPSDDFTFTGGPFVTGLTPAGGPASGGTAVFISGGGFTGATAVTFGGVAAIPLVTGDSSITVLAPPHVPGTVDVIVFTPLGSSANTLADDYVYGLGPTVTGVSPNTGPATGGTSVVITGSGFLGTTSVAFGATAVSGSVVSDTTIVVTSPAHASATVSVRVTTPLGTSADTTADNFTFGNVTASYTLYFRWSVVVWNGVDSADILTALKGQETPDNPATNNVSAIVTAIYRYNNPQQRFEGFFPGGAGIPGANDFSTFSKGQSYWVASNGPGTITWTAVAS
jgi:hypothetical protein